MIPVYNGESFLLRTLLLNAAQTVRLDRLTVVDNCSTDGSEKIRARIRGDKVRMVSQPEQSWLVW